MTKGHESFLAGTFHGVAFVNLMIDQHEPTFAARSVKLTLACP